MKLHILSDLHHECYRTRDGGWGATGRPTLAATDADVIVLAGDIDEGTAGIAWAAEEAARLGKPILYVPGNHEFYGHDVEELRAALRAAAAGTGVHLLDTAGVVIAGVRFLGATLWTDFGNLHRDLVGAAWATMADYHAITARGWWAEAPNRARAHAFGLTDTSSITYPRPVSPTPFNPLVAFDLHQSALAWLRAALEAPFAGRTVVITHHAPSYASLARAGFADYLEASRWVHHLGNARALARPAAYASNLEGLLDEVPGAVDLWVHGHLHQALDYAHRGLRVVCNPHGYPWRRPEAQTLQALGIDPDQVTLPPDPEPFAGDAPGFAAHRVIDLAAGLWPALRPELAPQFARLSALIEDLAPLIGYLGHADPHVVTLARHYVDDRAEAFDATLRAILERVLASTMGAANWFDGLDLLDPVRLKLLLGDEATGCGVGTRLAWQRAREAAHFQQVGEAMLARMRATRAGLPGEIEAALARQWRAREEGAADED